MFDAGCSFWANPDPHLYFVLSDPHVDDTQVLYVNVTSYHATALSTDAENDPACIIEIGEHPFITAVSCMYYYGAQVASVGFLEHKQQNGNVNFHSPASHELLQKMRTCAGGSIHMIPETYDILVQQQLVD